MVDRKRALRKIMPKRPSRLLYVDHVDSGEYLFRLTCERDLEGIVAKRRGTADGDPTSWLKIKNRRYTQIVEREELFENSSHVYRACIPRP